MEKSVTPQQAWRLLLSIKPPAPAVEHVPLTASLNRVLAEDIYAAIAIPPFDRSPFDGYAFRAADTYGATRENPVTLAITEELPAGSVPTIPVTEGTAAKILTGAPIPPGADSTIKYEQTEFTAQTVKIFETVRPNSNVVYAGDDVPAGELLAAKGTAVSPADIGLFASIGMTAVPVFRRPRAAVLNTGSELVEPGETLPPAKIYNSSVFTLIGTLSRFGVDAYNAGVVRDDPDEIAERIKSCLQESDIVITTGGASVGDYDFSVTAAERLGARPLFWKTKVKPGGSLIASEMDGKLILSLSGNPGAALMTLLYIASPFVKRLAGHRQIMPNPIRVILGESFDKTGGDTVRLLRGRLIIEEGGAYFITGGAQGGGALSSFTDADLIAEIPPGSAALPAGTVIYAYYI